MSVTIKDIAKATSISVPTVARALKTPEKVSEKKRKIILSAAEKMGYVPNINACNLKTNSSHNIGFLINDVQNIFFNKIISVVESELSKAGYRLIISFGAKDSEEFNEKIINYLSLSVNAILFSPFEFNQRIENLLKINDVYALQLFSCCYETVDSLIVDDTNGMYLATKRLLRDGHKKILIAGIDDHSVWEKRVIGYKKALAEANIPLDNSLIFGVDSLEAVEDKLASRIVKDPPTAIIPVANEVSMSCLKALRDLKMTVGKDISVICYDDSEWANLLGISVITHPTQELGVKIAKMVLNGIKEGHDKPIEHQMIEPFIYERHSVVKI